MFQVFEVDEGFGLCLELVDDAVGFAHAGGFNNFQASKMILIKSALVGVTGVKVRIKTAIKGLLQGWLLLLLSALFGITLYLCGLYL